MGRYIRNPYLGKEAASSEEVTEKWLEQAVKTIADQIINREFDDEEKQDVGPYTGLSGVAFALNKAAPIVGSKAASAAEKCWQYCERSSSRQARFLCGDLGLYVTQMSNPEMRQSLVEKIEKLSVTLAKVGCFTATANFYDLLSDTEERAVRESADWLMSTQDDEGNFASSVKWIGRERGDDQLVHWCHGAPGVILLCLTMWKRYGEQKYFKNLDLCVT
ncbi:hypothetical protein ANCCAN_25897 [Ancylostoma caninum]|uniref:Lanthionine synthetase C-like protein n=1 Tax=Ancylostoma caninum TaxID=29170 RepID=A0A368FBH4_ANCCA|nr:hypothetical protein ANCCAN_25897 [Ancylostoma caninum]